MKIYDVYFRSVSPSVISVGATSKEKAVEEAEKLLNSMSKEELVQRLLTAYEYTGFEIVQVEDTGGEE